MPALLATGLLAASPPPLTAMGASGRWMLWTWCVCLAAREDAAVSVTMGESSLEVVRGDVVVLPCSFLTATGPSRLNVIWTLAPSSSPESPVQVIVYDHGQVIEDPSLAGRVGFTGLPARADIMLNDTRVSDAGVYRCMVNNPPEPADPGIGELLLSVLEPPSLPVCQWDGDIELGGSVQLSCSVAEGVPTPDVRWERVNPGDEPVPVDVEGELKCVIDRDVSLLPQGRRQAPSRWSTCPLRRPACTAAPPPTSWEPRTATSTWPFTEPRTAPPAYCPACC
ncbi:immunoglobulin superfamily member 11 isoform X2 [Cololabis saira]|uniref:immunoglobulin superfamily member 11 isoform X2 n=1 Tax=Cololabis saira TaxID=129043 RepID=UPI002AD4764E|nr:immunoglobulin superfamily member 11 isoform X2 [Cololabis saira]